MVGGSSKSTQDDLDFWGAPDEYRSNDVKEYEVYESNWTVVQLFLRLQTQWRMSPMGQRSGLVYSSVDIVLKAMELEFTPELFADLQVLEIAFINECAENGNR